MAAGTQNQGFTMALPVSSYEPNQKPVVRIKKGCSQTTTQAYQGTTEN